MTEFYRCKTTKDGHLGACKDCKDAACKEWNRKNKNRLRELHRRSKYGISPEQFKALGDKCGVCGATEDLCVDHDHKTGKVRGLLCRKHNMGIGLLGDNIETLEAAVRYLKKNG